MTMRYAIVPLALVIGAGAIPAAAQTVWDSPRTQLAPAQPTVQRTVVRERVVPRSRYTQREIRRASVQPATRVVTRERIVIRPVVRERVVTVPQTIIPGSPLALTQNQMNFVYDSIVAQPVQSVQPGVVVTTPTRPLVMDAPETVIAPAPIARDRYIVASPSTRRVITTAPITTGFAAATLAVGEPVPSWVQLYAMPRATVAAVPELGRYYYAIADDRVFLVDPVDNIVVTELYR